MIKLSHNKSSIIDKIYTIRNTKVMLDSDLAILYKVPTKQMNRAIRRNIDRFPSNFMFQLTEKEFDSLRCQIGTSNTQQGGRRYLPLVFTQEGVAMLSGVLKSTIAIEISIKIMEAFVAMRKFVYENSNLFNQLEYVNNKILEHDKNFKTIFKALKNDSLQEKQGIFFDGQIFDAHKFISDLIKDTHESIILIDNFIDDSVLTLFSERKNNVKVTIYTKEISKKLKLDLEKFNSQYAPIEVKKFNKSHDRFLILDDKLYHFGASLKDLGKKWFAFSRFDIKTINFIDKLP